MKLKKVCLLISLMIVTLQISCAKAPTPLDKVHEELERILDPETLSEIDSLESADEMISYHHSIGMMLRNEFGLWKRNSELYGYLYNMGLRHPDDMSSVVLESFWARRHGADYNMEEKVKYYVQYWEDAERREKEEKERYSKALSFIWSNMPVLDFVDVKVPEISLPSIQDEGSVSLCARYLARYDGGVFVLVRKYLGGGPLDAVYGSVPYKISLETNAMSPVSLSSLDSIESSVLIGDTVWVYGKKGERGKLFSLNDGIEKEFPLPLDEPYPVLGFDSENLIAVYSKSVYELSDSGQWKLIFSSGDEIPRSGVPPRIHDGILYLRDEGVGENQKALWIVDLEKSTAEKFHAKTGLVGNYGPRWENNFSYSIDKNVTLLVTAGEGSSPKSVLSLSKSGKISVLIFENQIKASRMISVPQLDLSAVSVGKDYTLLAGQSGLFTLFESVLCPVVYFKNAEQKIPVNEGKNMYHWGWRVSDVLELDMEDFVISGSFGGIFRLKKTDGFWRMTLIEP